VLNDELTFEHQFDPIFDTVCNDKVSSDGFNHYLTQLLYNSFSSMTHSFFTTELDDELFDGSKRSEGPEDHLVLIEIFE